MIGSDDGLPQPCLKWAGGKRELVKTIYQDGLFPEYIDTYYEPFFGAGAVFFYLWKVGLIKKAIVSDINFDLINVYKHIKEKTGDLIEFSMNMDLEPNETTYYNNRARFNQLKTGNCKMPDELLERAILMIYLNRTSYSGMYRENSKGLFNVPFGYYPNPTIIDCENLWKMKHSFENVEFRCGDFSDTLRYCHFNENDFIYMDPPYMTDETGKGFVSYNKMKFFEDDQMRLAKCYTKLSRRNVKIMLSNSSSSKIFNLYKDVNKIQVSEGNDPISTLSIRTVYAPRYINARNNGFEKVPEYLIMNY